jgi:putative ABC transport system permease protein
MLKNYLTVAFRTLWRNKVHTSINVIGLSLGIACCVLIVLFVKDEWTFDTFHSKADRIYRVWAREDWGVNQVFFYTTTPFPMGPTLKENFPEVEHQVRINRFNSQIKAGNDQFSQGVAFGGENFFDVFDFRVIAGDRENALRSQNGVVLTRRMAINFFGEADPIGKVIQIQLGEVFEDFVVKAVTEDIPTNSSIRFAVMISDLNYPKLYSQQSLTSGWFNITPETFVLLREGVDAKEVEKKFPSVFKTVLGEENFTKSKYTVGLQPITSIHLGTDFPAGGAPVSNPKYAAILAAAAFLILLVACINFVTLSIGRSLRRAKEVGIRKVVGAERKQLIFQFIGEALIISVISLMLGLVLAVLNLPLFNTLSGKQLIFPLDGFMALVVLCLIGIIGIISGSYPAFVLSAFKPIAMLKGGFVSGNSRLGLRKILVGVQLILSIFLISSTLLMRKQLWLLQNKNLGFNEEQLATLQLNVPRVAGQSKLAQRIKIGFEKAEQFKPELSKFPGVAAVCASSHDFGDGSWTNIGYTDDTGVYRSFNANVIDDDYIPVMKIEFAAGRNFSSENPSDLNRSIIVNEAFVKEYGWKDPIGKRIPGKGFSEHEIIGVVKDFNYTALYTKVEPLVLVMDPVVVLSGSENINFDNSPIPKLVVRLSPGNMQATIDQVKTVWEKLTGGEEFAFSFVDERLAAQYRNDQNLGKIISIATMLAIVIGSLGLYGLASLAMQNRTKEISIRKILGATEKSLLVLLSKEYVYLVGISLILSVPITWYLMSQWLQSFEYRVEIGFESFLVAGGISLLIALFTISYQTTKTASAQPAETLKYE